jgi:hypothetical protein
MSHKRLVNQLEPNEKSCFVVVNLILQSIGCTY